MKPRSLIEKRKQLHKTSTIARMIKLEMEEALHRGNTDLLEIRLKKATEITAHAVEIWQQIRTLRSHSPRPSEKIKVKVEEFRQERARILPLLETLTEQFHDAKLQLKMQLGALYHSYHQTINSIKARIGSSEEEILRFDEISPLLNLISFGRSIEHTVQQNTRQFWEEIHQKDDFEQAA